MPVNTLEQKYSTPENQLPTPQENQPNQEESLPKVHELELGDSTVPTNTSSDDQTQPTPPPPPPKPQKDPIELIQSLFSIGFKPSVNQIKNLNRTSAQPDNSKADEWFRFFVRKLINQEKKRLLKEKK